MHYERLSSQDATLFCAEAPTAPLQVGALCLFEAGPLVDAAGRIRIDELRHHISGRLGRTPRFRQKLVPVPFGQGRPVWVDDPSFDICHHVRLAALPRPGGPAELRDFMSSLLEVPLDRSRPLWEVWLVEGVGGDRVAVIPKVNHVMADGPALLEFALAVLDPSPDQPIAPRTPEPAPQPDREPDLHRAELLVSGLADRRLRQVRLARQIASSWRHPARLLAQVRAAVSAVGSTAVPAPKLALTHPVGPHRDFVWRNLPLEDLRALARTRGVTLNDAVLAVVAGALRDHLAVQPGADVRPRVLVPVSTHGDSQSDTGNRFSMMIADLPLAAPDPLHRLAATHAEMQRRKRSSQRAVTPALFALGDIVAPWLLRSIAPVVLRRQPFVNLAVTNIPGPDEPMYLFGSRLLAAHPFVTVTGNIALIVGVLSYHGALGVGLTADADAIVDLDHLGQAIEGAAADLIAAANADSARTAGTAGTTPAA